MNLTQAKAIDPGPNILPHVGAKETVGKVTAGSHPAVVLKVVFVTQSDHL